MSDNPQSDGRPQVPDPNPSKGTSDPQAAAQPYGELPGQQQPSQPLYGAAPHNAPYYVQPYSSAQPYYSAPPYAGTPYRGTNGLAVAALCTCWVLWGLLGIIFGFVALNQIKRTGQSGRGLAIAGLTIGFCFLGLILLLTVYGFVASAVASGTAS